MTSQHPGGSANPSGMSVTMDPVTELVTLRPLATGGVARLVAAGLGAEPEPGFATACWDATGGSPFLVRRLIAALREEGVALPSRPRPGESTVSRPPPICPASCSVIVVVLLGL